MNPTHRKRLLWRLRYLVIKQALVTITQLPISTIRFTLLSGLLTLSLLSIMPHHPLTIPAALGGGLSISLFIHSLSRLVPPRTPAL